MSLAPPAGVSFASSSGAGGAPAQPHLDLGDLPDLSFLSDGVRNIIEGKVIDIVPLRRPKRICVYTCADKQGNCIFH